MVNLEFNSQAFNCCFFIEFNTRVNKKKTKKEIKILYTYT